MITWEQVNPTGYWVLVRADKQQEKTQGGIILTQNLGGDTIFGYYTGRILKFGDKVLDFLNCNREDKITAEDLLNNKLVYKNYLVDAVKFMYKDSEDRTIFMLHLADPNLNIIGLAAEDELVELV